MSMHSMGGGDHDFDASLRNHHAQAVANLSTRTQAQLQLRRRVAAAPARPSSMRMFAWPLAAACAAGVLAIGLQWRQPGTSRPDTSVPTASPVATSADTTNTDDESAAAEFDTYATLDEAPDLYLWLASNDATTLAME